MGLILVQSGNKKSTNYITKSPLIKLKQAFVVFLFSIKHKPKLNRLLAQSSGRYNGETSKQEEEPGC